MQEALSLFTPYLGSSIAGDLVEGIIPQSFMRSRNRLLLLLCMRQCNCSQSCPGKQSVHLAAVSALLHVRREMQHGFNGQREKGDTAKKILGVGRMYVARIVGKIWMAADAGSIMSSDLYGVRVAAEPAAVVVTALWSVPGSMAAHLARADLLSHACPTGVGSHGNDSEQVAAYRPLAEVCSPPALLPAMAEIAPTPPCQPLLTIASFQRPCIGQTD